MVGEVAKAQVMERIADGRSVKPLPKSKAQIGEAIVHVRFRSNAKKNSTY
jgi:hypothetical protein